MLFSSLFVVGSAAAHVSGLITPKVAARQDDGAHSGQQIALAAYIDPRADAWDRIVDLPSEKVTVVVANVKNGPDSTYNAAWADAIHRTAASGKKVLGYVRTGFFSASVQHYTTRLGSSNLSDWAAQIQEDIDRWYRFYPDDIGGIFFDEALNVCGGTDNTNAELFKFITQQTKRNHPGVFTVLNAGTPVPQCFEDSADTLLTYENSYAAYTSSFVDIDWTPSDPRKIWHLIYQVPASEVQAAAALALERGAGVVQITDDDGANPYDTLPSQEYLQQLLDVVAGGTPLDEGVFPWPGLSGPAIGTFPGSLSLDSVYYSSATLNWPVADGALGYRIFQDGEAVLALINSTTSVTVGGLQPGTQYQFGITTINGDGTDSDISNLVSATTPALPDRGKTVGSTSVSAGATKSTFWAHTLVPYDSARLFIYSGPCDFTSPNRNLGWSINWSAGTPFCNQYLVEEGVLYLYTGSVPDGQSNAPWAWTLAEDAMVSRKHVGHDWIWTLPLGTSTVDPNQFIVQFSGYSPMVNVFHECIETGEPALPGVFCA